MTARFMPIHQNGFSMKFIVRRVNELNEAEYKACYSLNLRNDGFMREKLVELRYAAYSGWAYMVWKDDKLMSWSLVFEHGLGHGAYFYTRHSARGKGYATIVAQYIEEDFDSIDVWPSDTPGDRFFSKYSFSKSYKYWAG